MNSNFPLWYYMTPSTPVVASMQPSPVTPQFQQVLMCQMQPQVSPGFVYANTGPAGGASPIPPNSGHLYVDQTGFPSYYDPYQNNQVYTQPSYTQYHPTLRGEGVTPFAAVPGRRGPPMIPSIPTSSRSPEEDIDECRSRCPHVHRFRRHSDASDPNDFGAPAIRRPPSWGRSRSRFRHSPRDIDQDDDAGEDPMWSEDSPRDWHLPTGNDGFLVPFYGSNNPYMPCQQRQQLPHAQNNQSSSDRIDSNRHRGWTDRLLHPLRRGVRDDRSRPARRH